LAPLYSLPSIDTLVARVARREFARAMTFTSGETPVLPFLDGDGLDRLLYVHVPFCEKLCPYCSFNRVAFDEGLCRRYFTALRKELRLYRDLHYDFRALYAGGGTPTIIMEELLETLSLARELFSIAEISVETNPNHLTAENISHLRRAGVNRLSVGIQSFDDTLLKAMGRYDKYGSGREIMERLNTASGRFDTLNADMIFNFPRQEEASLRRDIAMLLDSRIDQITWYPLMVSDSTRRAVARTLGEVPFGREMRFYDIIVEGLRGEYGFSSAWCFSRKKSMIDEYIVDYTEYAGLGSGSIGYLQGRCYANTFDIVAYIHHLEKGHLPLMASRTFGRDDLVRYELIMRLFGGRLDLGPTLSRHGKRALVPLAASIIPFALAGGLRYRKGALVPTRRGRYYWVVLMREFFTAVNNFRDYCREEATREVCHG